MTSQRASMPATPRALASRSSHRRSPELWPAPGIPRGVWNTRIRPSARSVAPGTGGPSSPRPSRSPAGRARGTRQSSGPCVKPPFFRRAKTAGKSTLPLADVHQHFLGRQEVLHAHPDHQAVHGGGILHRVELAVRVVEDIARVIPQPEVLLADQLDGFAALRAGGVLAAVRLDAEADAFRGGVVAALGNGLVVELVELLVAWCRPASGSGTRRWPHHQ